LVLEELPPPHEVRVVAAQTRNVNAIVVAHRSCPSRILVNKITIRSIPASPNRNGAKRLLRNAEPTRSGNIRAGNGPVVIIVTVAVAEDVPFNWSELGEMAQVVSAGAPLQVSATVWLKPAMGATVIVYVAVAPGLTVAVCVDPGDREKSGPVPLSAAICKPPVALSLTEREVLRDPVPIGAKVTLIWQFAPGASGDADMHALVWLKSPAFVPVMEMPEMLSAAVPVFVSWTACGELVVPVACCAKVSELGAKLALVAPADDATASVNVFVCVRDPEFPVMITG
jgi:hypothetical protein